MLQLPVSKAGAKYIYIFDHFAQPHFELFVFQLSRWALLQHMCELAHCITLSLLPLPHSCKCSSYLLHIKFIFKRNLCMNRQCYLFICVLLVIWHYHIFLLRIHSQVDQFISKPANFNLEIQISRPGTNMLISCSIKFFFKEPEKCVWCEIKLTA